MGGAPGNATGHSKGGAKGGAKGGKGDGSSDTIPRGWTVYTDDNDGTPYYWNERLRTASWTKPVPSTKGPKPAGEGWAAYEDDATHITYYYNARNRQTTWTNPAEMVKARSKAKLPTQGASGDRGFMAAKGTTKTPPPCSPTPGTASPAHSASPESDMGSPTKRALLPGSRVPANARSMMKQSNDMLSSAI